MSTLLLERPMVVEAPTVDSTAWQLDAAAELLETDGWVQGAFGGPGGRCAQLAFATVGGDVAVLPRLFGLPPRSSVIGWNDAPGRTVEEVAGRFRAAAAWRRDETP